MTYPSRVFDHPNPRNFQCPVCKTKADRPVVLVPIPGQTEHWTVECQQWHAECFALVSGMLNYPPVSAKA